MWLLRKISGLKLLGMCVFLACYQMSGCGSNADEDPPGHQRPLGEHRPPEGDIDAHTGFMNPEEFFRQYLRPGRPVIFKGTAKASSAFEKWSDEYLTQSFGDTGVDVLQFKKERRASPVYYTELEHFLSIYEEEDAYMITPVTDHMLDDIGLPKMLLCGGVETRLDQVMLWMNSGGMKSVLHDDVIDNMDCLLDGKMKMVLASRDMAAAIEANGWLAVKGYSSLDVENVDMFAYPKLQELLWWQAEMEAGDCIYIPQGWYRQQTTVTGYRTVGIKYLYYDPMGFDKKHCEISEPLDEYGHLSMENFIQEPTLESFRLTLFSPFLGKDVITEENLKKGWKSVFSAQEIHALMKQFDINADGTLQWREVHVADLDWLTQTYGLSHDMLLAGKLSGQEFPVNLREGEEEGEEEYAIDLSDPETVPLGYIRDEL